jgi:hypothetical protein
MITQRANGETGPKLMETLPQRKIIKRAVLDVKSWDFSDKQTWVLAFNSVAGSTFTINANSLLLESLTEVKHRHTGLAYSSLRTKRVRLIS